MRRKFCPKRGGDISADIDIDFADRQQILDIVTTRAARIMHQGQPRRHNSGVYVTDIPWDPVTQCAAIDYETAESRGYFKIDLLNVGVYQLVRDPDHYQQMLDREPPWSRLWQDPDWATNLVHVGGHVNLLTSMRPDSIPRMAAFISVIRPGKAHLQNRPWDQVFASVWDGDSSRGFVFKKAHSISYAHLVALHMNLLDLAD
jgi:hypothetical protein